MNTQLTKTLVCGAAALSILAAFTAHAGDATKPAAQHAKAGKAQTVSMRRDVVLGLAIAMQGDAALARIRAESRGQIAQWTVPTLAKPAKTSASNR